MIIGHGLLKTLKHHIHTHFFQDTEEIIINHTERIYRQMEAFFSLCLFLQPRFPLPPARGWSGSPDFLLELANSIIINKPKKVIELGSGLSTLIIAYCLERNGCGSVISMDHDTEFAEQTRRLITRHTLSAYASIKDAPLKTIICNDFKGLWYSLPHELPTNVEMLIIDGPPSTNNLDPLTRYPALPMLRQYLAPSALIFLDDANRPCEQECLARWQEEIGFTNYRFLPHEKGTAIFSITNTVANVNSF